jgi:hypothetical protein
MSAHGLRRLFTARQQQARRNRLRRLQRHCTLQILEELQMLSAVQIFTSDATVLEGDSGTTDAVFTLSLSQAAAGPVTVDYTTNGVTAQAGHDFLPAAGTVTFAPGQTLQTLTVSVGSDVLDEGSELFFVDLTSATGATFFDNQGGCTITDNDAPPGVTLDDVTVTEGHHGAAGAVFTLTLSAPSGQAVTVNYRTSDGSASAGLDFDKAVGAVVFPAGQTQHAVTVPVKGELRDEGNETFSLELVSATNATINDNQGAGTILDDDWQLWPPAPMPAAGHMSASSIH